MSYGCSKSGDASGFRGCGRVFGGLAMFDRHFVKVTTADDPTRDRATVGIDGKRCGTDAELLEKGLEPRKGNRWVEPMPEAVVSLRARKSQRRKRA